MRERRQDPTEDHLGFLVATDSPTERDALDHLADDRLAGGLFGFIGLGDRRVPLGTVADRQADGLGHEQADETDRQTRQA